MLNHKVFILKDDTVLALQNRINAFLEEPFTEIIDVEVKIYPDWFSENYYMCMLQITYVENSSYIPSDLPPMRPT